MDKSNSVDSVRERVLVLAPTGQDGTLVAGFLEKNSITCTICRDVDEVVRWATEGAGAIVLAEEALTTTSVSILTDWLEAQPSWSDIPLVVVTSPGEASHESIRRQTLFSNVILLERPFRPLTLVNTIRSALRSRRKQYQVRDLLLQHHRVLSSITDAYFALDRQWRFLEMNAVAEKLIFHRSSAQLMGKVLTEEYPQVANSPFLDRYARAFIDQQPVHLEERSPIVPRWFEVHAYPSGGRMDIYLRDITERKESELALALAREELRRHADALEKTVAERTAKLRETIAELEAFSYSISHDMRSPLRAMQGFAVILRTEVESKLSPEQAEYLRRIERAAERLDNLIQEVLNYSRVARAEIKLHPVDLHVLVGDIIANYPEFQAPTASVAIEGRLPTVIAQEAYLTQVLSNLMANAVKFVAPGVAPRVTVTPEIKGRLARIWVCDNGIGIAPENHSRIFNIFERIEPDKNYVGTGIGLSIARKAIERMAGSIGVESQPGAGSRFWIELPLP